MTRKGFGRIRRTAVAGQARHACGRCAKGMSRYHPCACGNHQRRNWGDRDTWHRECLSRHGPMMGNSESEVGPMFACQVGRFCSGHTNNVWYYELMSTHATFGKGTKLRMSMSSRSLLLDSKYSHNVDWGHPKSRQFRQIRKVFFVWAKPLLMIYDRVQHSYEIHHSAWLS